MTDTPSQRPAEPAAPESADAATAPPVPAQSPPGSTSPVPPSAEGTPEEPQRRSYARVGSGGGSNGGPDGTAGSGRGEGAGVAPGGAPHTAPHPTGTPSDRVGPVRPQTPGWEWSGAWIPKPGIIPLRPLSLSEILNGVIALLRIHWRTLLTLCAGVAVITQTAIAFATAGLPTDSKDFSFNTSTDSPAELHRAVTALGDLGVLAAASGSLSLLAGLWATALLTLVTRRAVMGQAASVADAWREARSRLLPLLGLSVLVVVVVGGVVTVSAAPALVAQAAGASYTSVAALALLVIPGAAAAVWLYVYLLLAVPALMLEGQSIRGSIERSIRLVRNAWWRVFGITLLVGLITSIATSLIGVVFVVIDLAVTGLNTDASGSASSLALGALSGCVAAALSLPVTGGTTVLLYIDQRIRREALDVELADAVGIPNYGS